MALRVDDILITDKNVFVMSEGRQMVADIETEATTAEFENSVAVNPWNLYTDDGRIVSNLYDSAGFDLRTQTLLPNSRLSPTVKDRHDDLHMPNAGKYVGQCQVGDVGYALTDFTEERFVAPVIGNDSYEAGYGFSMYYYLSSLTGGDSKYLVPDLIFNPDRGVQYVNEYPMGRYHSDFGDNELDVEGTDIDRPTVYADTYLTKYFYDRTYSVDGRVVPHAGSHDTVDFGGARTYCGIGHNGDTTYLVYRNDRTLADNEYGLHRPHGQEQTAASFELATVARLANCVAVVTRTSDYGKYAMYSSSDFGALVTPFGKLGDDIVVLASYEPKDESFVLYAATSGENHANRNVLAAEPTRAVNVLVYVPKVGGFDCFRTYTMNYGTTDTTLTTAVTAHYEKLSEMTFIELESSVLIGTRHNGSFNVVSPEYDYLNTVDADENAKIGFDPFLQPHLCESPDNRKAVSSGQSLVDKDGRSDVFYNGTDIVALKHYEEETDDNGAVTYKNPRIYLSRDYTDSNGRLFLKGCFFAAAVSPEKARNSEFLDKEKFTTDSFATSAVDTVPDGFRPLFDYCPVTLEHADSGFMLETKVFDNNRLVGVNATAKYAKSSASNVNGKVWSVSDKDRHRGSNCIRVQLQNKWQAEAVIDIAVPDGAVYVVTFNIAIREFFRHLKFTAFKSFESGSWQKAASIDRTKSVVGSEGIGGSEPFMKAGTITFKNVSVELNGAGTHSVKLRFEDVCDVGPCPYDYALVNGISVYERGGKTILETGDAVMDDAGNIVLRRATPLNVSKGSYAFIQFDPSVDGTDAPTLGMCKVEDIFRNGGWIGTSFCGPINSGRVLQENKKFEEIAKKGGVWNTPVCTGVQLAVQSGIRSTLSDIVKGTPFPLSTYKNLDSMYGADSGLLALYSVNVDGTTRIFTTFSTLPFDRENDESTLTKTTIGNREIVIDGVGSEKREYVEGYPIGRVVATPVYCVNASTELHDTSVCLVKWNTDCGYSNESSAFNHDDPDQPIAGYHLQYLGIDYDMYVEGSDSYSKTTKTVVACPNGIKNCRNHPDKTTTVTQAKHDRKGYVYPAPAYYDFRTAGTGLRVFDGPLGDGMKLGDVSILDGYLVVTNYSVGEAKADEGTPGGRSVVNPFPATGADNAGGYVVAPLRAFGDVQTTADMYETETLLSETVSGGTGDFRFLYRLSPKRGIDVYPASVAGVQWKPYYAGTKVDFIKFNDGYYYIAMTKGDDVYDIVETDSLMVERPLTKIAVRGRVVSGIRFFTGIAVVEYRDVDGTTTLEWFPQGRIGEKKAIGYSEFEGVYGLNPTNFSVHSCAGDVVVTYGNVYGRFSPPTGDANAVEADFRMYDETFCEPCIIDKNAGDFVSYGVVCASQNRGNYLIRYSSSEPFSVVDSSFDNRDEIVPMSGVHNLFDRRFLVVDDAYRTYARGNGVHVRAPNGSFTYARRVDLEAGSISAAPTVADVLDYSLTGNFTVTRTDVGGDYFSREPPGGESSTGYAEVRLTYKVGGWNIKWKSKGSDSYADVKNGDNDVIWSNDDVEERVGLTIVGNPSENNTITVKLVRVRTGVEIPLREMTEGCFKFIGSASVSGENYAQADRFCSVVDMTNGDLYVSRNFSDLGGVSYECGEVFVKVPGVSTAFDGFHVEGGGTDNVVCKTSYSYTVSSISYLHRFPDVTCVELTSKTYQNKFGELYKNGIGKDTDDRISRAVALSSSDNLALFAGNNVSVATSVVKSKSEISRILTKKGDNAHGSVVAFVATTGNDEQLFTATVTTTNNVTTGSISAIAGTEGKLYKFTDSNIILYDDEYTPTAYVSLVELFAATTPNASTFSINPSSNAIGNQNYVFRLADVDEHAGMYYALYGATVTTTTVADAAGVSFTISGSCLPSTVSTPTSSTRWDAASDNKNFKTADSITVSSDGKVMNWGSSSIPNFSGVKLSDVDYWLRAVSFGNTTSLFKVTNVVLDNKYGGVRSIEVSVPSGDIKLMSYSTVLLNGYGANGRIVGEGCSYNTYSNPSTYNWSNGRPLKGVPTKGIPVNVNGGGEQKTYTLTHSNGYSFSLPGDSTHAGVSVKLTASTSNNADGSYSLGSLVATVVVTAPGGVAYRWGINGSGGETVLTDSSDTVQDAGITFHTDGSALSAYWSSLKGKQNVSVKMFRLSEKFSKRGKPMTITLTTAPTSISSGNKVLAPGSIPAPCVGMKDLSVKADDFDVNAINVTQLSNFNVATIFGPSMTAALSTSSISAFGMLKTVFDRSEGDGKRMAIAANDRHVVIGTGSGGLLYCGTESATAATVINGMKYVDVASVMTDERTGDTVVSSSVRDMGAEVDDIASSYDNVEAVYSLNRFASNTLHKSNLFSVRIEDLGIADSPYLTDRQKDQLTMWVKNRVKDLVDAVKPAHTELFDVIVD